MPNILKNKKEVFYLKHRLYATVSILLFINALASTGLALILYNYVLYLRVNLPLWLDTLIILLSVLTAHFSYVAFKGLATEVGGN